MANTSDEPDAVPPTPSDNGETLAASEPGSHLDSIVSRMDTSEAGSGARSQPDPAPVAMEPPSKPQPASRRRGGFLGVFLGGVCAAALGFAAATYVLPKVPPEWRPFPLTDTGTTSAIEAQAARIEMLSQDIARLQQAPAPLDRATLDAELAGLRKELAAAPQAAPDLGPLESRLADLDNRLSALEKRPVAGGAASSTAIDALSRELEALRSQVAQQASTGGQDAARIATAAAEAQAQIKAATEEAARLKSDTEQIARQSRAESALRLMQAALDSGASFAAALKDLEDVGVAVPPELQKEAEGIPTLAQLRDTFPEAARQALAVTLRPAADATALDRLGAFLRGQTGARSLTPREGNDPDAILSRAEAALSQGDLGATLTELRSLPPEVQAPMIDWITQANRRQAVLDAAASLSAKIN